jgi:WhiB family redox-sensing transcriptional regulator
MGEEPLPWMGSANCASVGGDPFFPEKGDSAKPAKKICKPCPVAEQCLAYAMDRGITKGIWGGLTPRQRAQLRKEAA